MKTGKKSGADSLSLHLRLRIVHGKKIALGPGKVELLAWLQATGSISEAARRMGMSYMKAWSLIQTMKPLVETARGGQSGGGARLTPAGIRVLALYQKMERDGRRACESSWAKMRRFLQSPG